MSTKALLSILKKNAPSILSGMAVGGVILTGYLAHKAGRKWNPDKKFKEQWKNYIPMGIAAGGTVACIVGANVMHLKIETAMAGAIAFYKASTTELEQFEDNVYDKFGDAGLRENLQTKNDISISDVEIEVYEPYTKQYFKTTRQELLWAELEANKLLSAKGTVKLNEVLALYKNCKQKPIGNILGWSWDEDWFNESASYYWHGGWIDLCPQWDDRPGKPRFVLDYGINPMELNL